MAVVILFFLASVNGVFSAYTVMNPNKTKATELLRQYSKPERTHSITNKPLDITEYHQLSQGCLLHLINYRNLDLVSKANIVKPLVLSRYDVLKILYNVTKLKIIEYKIQALIFPFEKTPRNKSASIPYCMNMNYENRCYDIQAQDRTSRTKPWSCEIHLYAYPPTRQEQPNYYEWQGDELDLQFFIIPGAYKRFFYEVPRILPDNITAFFYPNLTEILKEIVVSRQQLDILLLQQQPTYNDTIIQWANALTVYRDGLYNVDPSHTSSNRELVVRFDEGNYIWICHDCVPCQTYGFKILKPVYKLTDFERQMNIEKLTHIGKIFWNTHLESSYLHALEGVSDDESSSFEYKLLLTLYSRLNGKFGKTDLEYLRFDAEWRILKGALTNISILRQYPLTHRNTYVTIKNKYNCALDRFGVDPVLHLFTAGKEDYFHFHLHPTKLKFVSCGDPSTRGLGPAFLQLVSVFDKFIWTLIAIMTVISTYVAYVINNWYNFADYVKRSKKLVWSRLSICFGFIKILIEQGDPINAKILAHHSPIRLICASFLLVGIVLSNLFKNENITQITLPLQPIPYDSFPSLVKNNFVIYTRATVYGSLSVNRIVHKGFANLLWLVHPRGNYSNHYVSIGFQSELFHFAKAETSVRNWQYWLFPIETLPVRIQKVMKHTRLHSRWMEMLIYGMIEKDILEECNKTALLLPDLEANSVYYELKKEGKSAFLGEDLDIRKQFGILFERRVNPFILIRVKGLFMAGLFDWWTNMIVNEMTKIKSGFLGAGIVPRTSSDMNGNIAVVFVLFLVGVSVAIFRFLFEVRGRISGGLVFCYKTAIKTINILYCKIFCK